ncbi:hypothetical protein SOVF_083240 [Spinacia oleracea]|uniref:Transmembrane protein 161B n=1 Tax=Spinacia oleracea TaxID=3562 RepID=A0A9R0JPI8_SPIOL|nr:uncharacterized protein LOC110782483 [Spinacia oleracea]KNA17085.1 hypothetical protein SOVF_083240 [Spinacia oleracea]
MYTLVLSYKNLIFQIILSLSLSIILYFISLPSLILQGLNTYIHPDDVNPTKQTQSSGPKVAIRRPSDQNVNGSSELRNRKKPREKLFEFDETKAQIFRLRLGDAQICSRLYFDSFRSCLNCFVVAFSCFLLHKYLILNVGESENENDNGNDNVDYDYTTSGVLKNGSLVPIVIGILGFFRVLISLFRVSIERSAFKRSERGLGLVIGVLGFFASLVICVGVYPWLFDFEFSSIDGFGKLFVALLSGSITGFLYLAAGKNARAFWLGTDQIRCNLPIISCGWFAQVIFYANYLLLGFTSLLWINPLGELLVNKNIDGGRNGVSLSLVGNVGMAEADFVKFRLLCLLLSGVLQVIALRWYVQTFLNEAVLSWYQRLHASVVPDMEYSRAKVFLHNHYLCLAVIQFFAPAALVLLSLGLSQVDEGLFENFEVACVLLPCSAFVKEVALFLAWWVSFVWFVFTSTYLAFYRRGILYIS